jgi:hypothetical protein
VRASKRRFATGATSAPFSIVVSGASWEWVDGTAGRGHLTLNAVLSSLLTLRRNLVLKWLEDEYGNKRGYIVDVFGIFRLLKYKVSKIMEKDDYIMILEIFGKEFILK